MSRMLALPVIAHALLAAAALVLFQVVKGWLDASYAASRHPVDYATGQLSFDADRIAGYYRVMEQAGTLPVYWRTQFIDFAFLLSVAVLGVVLCTLAARLWPEGSRMRTVALLAAGAAVAGAACDAAENLLSFVMLNLYPAIPQTLALAYSATAAAKFGLLTLAMGLFVLTVVAGLLNRGLKLLQR